MGLFDPQVIEPALHVELSPTCEPTNWSVHWHVITQKWCHTLIEELIVIANIRKHASEYEA